jgi:transposase
MTKAFKFRLYPIIDQSKLLTQNIDICSFDYNWALDQKIKT